MARPDRTFNLGRLHELKEKRRRLRIEVDADVKALLYHFEPMDIDCEYVDKIDPRRLRIYTNRIERNINELQKVHAEIERLKNEVGGNGV